MTGEEAAMLMRNLPEDERNQAIIEGRGVVVDCRPQFFERRKKAMLKKEYTA